MASRFFVCCAVLDPFALTTRLATLSWTIVPLPAGSVALW